MSVSIEHKKVTLSALQKQKAEGRKIAMLTAYDYTFARLLDGAGVDILLVGDSAANVMAGYTSTLPITLEQMIYHTAAVARGTQRAMVVADLPFGSYQGDPQWALASAVRMMKEGGAEAVKIEGGTELCATVERLSVSGIPVMGHLGLTPQHIHRLSGYGLRARADAEAQKLMEDALALQQAGVFALVLEKIPAKLAAGVTARLKIPTIGIGAGNGCDGQVLVMQDMLGLNPGFRPKFVRQFANLSEMVQSAVGAYIKEVQSGHFPNGEESY